MDDQKSCGFRQAPKENRKRDEEREYEQNPLNRDVPQDSFQATPSDDGTASVPSEAAQDMEQTDRTSGQEEAADDREETVVRMTRPQTVAPSSQVTPDFRSSGSPSVVIRNGHHITVTNNSAFNMGPRAPGQFGPHTTVINNAVFNMGPRAPGNCGTHNTVTTNVIINPPQRHFHYHYHDPASSQKQSFDDYIRRAEEAAAYATGQVYPGPGSVFHHLGSTHVQNCSFNNQTFSSYTTVGDNRYTDSDSSDEDGPTVSGGVPVPNRPPRIGPRHAGYIVEGPESDDERETSSPPPPDTVSIMDMNGHTLDIGDAIWFGDLLDMTWAMYVGGRDIVYCQQDKSGIVVREELGFEQAFGKMWHKSPRGMHVFSRKERVERALSKVGEKFGGRLSLPCWAFTGMFYTEAYDNGFLLCR